MEACLKSPHRPTRPPAALCNGSASWIPRCRSCPNGASTARRIRDLATAAGLNVASLYHYFPSKRDLLVAVLEERGYLDDMAAAAPPTGLRGPTTELDDLLEEILRSMLDVEEFIRLMMGEVMRGDETALGLGQELMSSTQEALERWLTETQPELTGGPGGAPALARMLRAMVLGLFFEHLAGVLDGGDPAAAFRRRAEEAAAVLGSRLYG